MNKPTRLLMTTIVCLLPLRAGGEPKTLIFSPVTPEYVEVSAKEWAANGFGGFLFDGIMHNWDSDVWAVDKDPQTQGEADATLQKLRKCSEVCREAGIEDNFIKVAFYTPLPDWFDDAAWEKLNANFRNAAEFARLAGMRGVAIDIEYISDMYFLDWQGYADKKFDPAAVRAKALQRGEQMIAPMFETYPEMVLLTLPEGVLYYGPLAIDLTVGFIRAAQKRNAPGGVHILTEGTYQETDPLRLLSHVSQVDGQMKDILPPDLWDYWRQKGSIAIGCWPLGYYRELTDDKGNVIAYAGKREKFGDENIGSYADKSSNYPPETFAVQYAFANAFARRYNWIYSHGAVWWQFTEEEAERYKARSNDRLPVDERLDDFKAVMREKAPMTDPLLVQTAEQYRKDGYMDIVGNFGLITDWLLLGPFENQADPPNRNTAFRTQWIDTTQTEIPTSIATKDGKQMSWKLWSSNPYSGYVNPMSLFDPNRWMSYFVLCYVTSPDRRAAQLRTGSNDGIAVWVNGEKLYEVNRKRGPIVDDDVIDIVLSPGRNTILLQICQMRGTTGFYGRITDDSGELFNDLKYEIESEPTR
ncbi:MAG TPA: hypothetical protein PLZ55_07270 [bacterium]|nr:hypothetical protein [bacterium]